MDLGVAQDELEPRMWYEVALHASFVEREKLTLALGSVAVR